MPDGNDRLRHRFNFGDRCVELEIYADKGGLRYKVGAEGGLDVEEGVLYMAAGILKECPSLATSTAETYFKRKHGAASA